MHDLLHPIYNSIVQRVKSPYRRVLFIHMEREWCAEMARPVSVWLLCNGFVLLEPARKEQDVCIVHRFHGLHGEIAAAHAINQQSMAERG